MRLVAIEALLASLLLPPPCYLSKLHDNNKYCTPLVLSPTPPHSLKGTELRPGGVLGKHSSYPPMVSPSVCDRPLIYQLHSVHVAEAPPSLLTGKSAQIDFNCSGNRRIFMLSSIST